MRELDNKFWDVPITTSENNFLPSNTEWFISGRSAIRAIIKDSGITSITLPDWCCESMISPYIEANVSVLFYHAFQSDLKIETDAVLLMDYFGFISEKNLNGFNGTIIRDITHSIFSKQFDDADYYIGSLRKWAGFWTGGFAYGFKNKLRYDGDADISKQYLELRKLAMEARRKYHENQIDTKDYLDLYASAELLLDQVGIAPAADRDIELAKHFDIDTVKQQRRANASILLDAFQDEAIFKKLGENDCPLYVPIRISDRDAVRKYLLDNNIFCPFHWPVCKYHEMNPEIKKLYDTELSLVCDQRFNEQDMRKTIDLFRTLGRKML